MSYAFLPEIVMESWASLSPAACKVAGAVAYYMNNDATGCFPGIETVTKRAGYKNERTTQRAIEELREKGVLDVRRRPGRSNLYSWGGGVPQTTPVPQTTHKDTRKDTNTPSGDGALPKKKTKKTSKKPNLRPNGGDVWQWWLDAHDQASIDRPVSAWADTKAAKDLSQKIRAGELPEPELKDCLAAYLADPDKWLSNCGHPLRHLSGRINGYLRRIRGSETVSDETYQAALDAAEDHQPVGDS